MTANACMTDYTECMRSDAFAPSEFSCAEFNTVNVQSTAVMAVLCFFSFDFLDFPHIDNKRLCRHFRYYYYRRSLFSYLLYLACAAMLHKAVYKEFGKFQGPIFGIINDFAGSMTILLAESFLIYIFFKKKEVGKNENVQKTGCRRFGDSTHCSLLYRLRQGRCRKRHTL